MGTHGENLACEFLGRNGYRIIERNYRCPEGEVDIIASHGDTLVFVEVKTRKSRVFGGPEESITPLKKDRLRTVAAHYGLHRESLPESWRIDVVAIQVDGRGGVSKIELIESAVEDV
jgi:putative endonuclease